MPSSTTHRGVSTADALAIAVAVLALGLILGWHLRWDGLLQLAPGLVPTQHNTALGLLASAAAQLAYSRGWRRLCAACALFAGTLGIVSLLQYLLAVDFGIDQLLVTAHLTVGSSHPGRMSPYSGLALGLLNAALLLLLRAGRNRATVAALLVSLLLALALAALIGYLVSGHPLLEWHQTTLIAAHSAFGLLLLGLSLRLHLRHLQATQLSGAPPVAIQLLVVGLLIGSLLLWRSLLHAGDARALQASQTQLSWMATRIGEDLSAIDRPLRRMAERWDATGGTPEALWRADALNLLRDLPGLISLQRLDAEGTVRLAEPLPVSVNLVGTRPNQEPVRAALLAAARKSGSAVYSSPIHLLQGGTGLLGFVPLSGDEGFLVAVIDLEQRLHSVVESSNVGGAYGVRHGDEWLYRSRGFDAAHSAAERLLQAAPRPGLDGWQVILPIAPQSERSGALPGLILAMGVIAALLLQLALLWWWAGLRRAVALSEAGEAVDEANRRMAMAARVARIGIWEWRRGSRTLIWDRQTWELFAAEEGAQPAADVFAQCVEPSARSRLRRILRQSARDDRVVEADFAIRRMDDSQADLHLTARMLRNRAGRPARLLGVVMDVTERRRLDRLKNAFVSTVSHELRTPLTAISGALAIIDSDRLGSLPPAMNQLIDVARQNVARLAALIDDLLDVEAIASGGLRLAPRSLDLQDELRRALQLNRSYAERLGVRLVLRDSGDSPRVIADAERLQQVLANLLSNAAKFSSSGQQVELGFALQGQQVRVDVADLGSGVPDAFRDQLFSRFSQADGSDSRSHGGTGLGLSICLELVTRMGGTIGHAPRDGGGSVFWFTLPIDPDPAPAPPARA